MSSPFIRVGTTRVNNRNIAALTSSQRALETCSIFNASTPNTAPNEAFVPTLAYRNRESELFHRYGSTRKVETPGRSLGPGHAYYTVGPQEAVAPRVQRTEASIGLAWPESEAGRAPLCILPGEPPSGADKASAHHLQNLYSEGITAERESAPRSTGETNRPKRSGPYRAKQKRAARLSLHP